MPSNPFRERFSRESSCESRHQISSHRRMLSRRKSSSSPSPSSSRTSSASLQALGIFHSRSSSPTTSPVMRDGKRSSERETDAECWERMLNLQREYHCYNSARIEAAVEALDMGYNFEQVPIPSRLCLDLLNEELRAQIEAQLAGTNQ